MLNPFSFKKKIKKIKKIYIYCFQDRFHSKIQYNRYIKFIKFNNGSFLFILFTQIKPSVNFNKFFSLYWLFFRQILLFLSYSLYIIISELLYYLKTFVNPVSFRFIIILSLLFITVILILEPSQTLLDSFRTFQNS